MCVESESGGKRSLPKVHIHIRDVNATLSEIFQLYGSPLRCKPGPGKGFFNGISLIRHMVSLNCKLFNNKSIFRN